MIRAHNLSMDYGKFRALEAVSFEARSKEILGLLGPNGAGKTTTMRILTTYLYPSAGTAEVDGLDILKDPEEVRKRIGYLPETAPLYADMRVEDYLKFVGEARGLHGLTLATRLGWVREACGLDPVRRHLINELSKGYRQRAGLAQALIHNPKVLILDEPTSGLDPLQIIGIRSLIKELAREKTVIFSTHILQEVEAVADRIVIMNEGRVVAEGTLQELKIRVRGLPGIKPEPSLEDIFIALLAPEPSLSKS